jgi:hypothetical protein
LLQGSILDSHVEVLNHRLRGLCDNVDCGQERFHEKELVSPVVILNKCHASLISPKTIFFPPSPKLIFSQPPELANFVLLKDLFSLFVALFAFILPL